MGRKIKPNAATHYVEKQCFYGFTETIYIKDCVICWQYWNDAWFDWYYYDGSWGEPKHL
jgi:hypothetical protein